jgi:hypothetical protein
MMHRTVSNEQLPTHTHTQLTTNSQVGDALRPRLGQAAAVRIRRRPDPRPVRRPEPCGVEEAVRHPLRPRHRCVFLRERHDQRVVLAVPSACGKQTPFGGLIFLLPSNPRYVIVWSVSRQMVVYLIRKWRANKRQRRCSHRRSRGSRRENQSCRCASTCSPPPRPSRRAQGR